MNEFFKSLPWVIFWLVFAFALWIQHVQYMAGHETMFFVHKTPEEKRIREALIKQLEAGEPRKDRPPL